MAFFANAGQSLCENEGNNFIMLINATQSKQTDAASIDAEPKAQLPLDINIREIAELHELFQRGKITEHR